MSSQDQEPYVAACPNCDVTRQTDDPNEVINFYRRHYRVTGHDIEIEHAEPDLDNAVTANDLKDVIRELEGQHRNGVPMGVIAAVMKERGLSVKQTLDEIHELRMGGGLYEPQDDHLAAF
ncbi:hypothetical protein [Halocatena salina]|uniref:Uncharacterized protein n=1 Tax=Halocatena salina TaxID=2934340 RepID=A0A8U0A7T9_9EURY|nr:hypothetical protein [Halocatena salina]UPM44909.1 hypothetical protein MW046_16130 [Halocatena salina]